MTDEQLEQRLRALYRGEVREDETAPLSLRRDVAAIPQARSRPARWFSRGSGFTLLAAAALLVVGGAVAAGSGLLRLPSVVPPEPVPSPTPSPTPTPRSSPIGSMGLGRQVHTTTLLGDGRVLMVGGYGRDAALDTPLADAVVYDPTTDTFVRTSPLAEARGLHTATLLPDGHVLITGGGPASWAGAGAYLATAELYDPSAGMFSPTGSMSTPREDHTATLLRDGRVLVVGGNDVGSHTTASAEIYDPKTGTFTPTGSMKTARGFHTATLLADGRVLVTGGDAAAWDDSGPFLASAEIYDPSTGTFTTTGSMATGRAHHAATLLADGRVLITGGTPGQAGGNGSGTTSLTAAELYDPATGTFSPTGPMADGRVYHTATRLADGRVLVAGGLRQRPQLRHLPVPGLGRGLRSEERHVLHDRLDDRPAGVGELHVAGRRPGVHRRRQRRRVGPARLGRDLRPEDRHVQPGRRGPLTAG